MGTWIIFLQILTHLVTGIFWESKVSTKAADALVPCITKTSKIFVKINQGNDDGLLSDDSKPLL